MRYIPSPENTFGPWLDRALRTRRDDSGAWMSQRKLAEAVGVQPPAINKIISGHTRPSADLVIRIANRLGEDASALLQLAGYEAPESELTLPTPSTPAKAEMVRLVKQLLDDDDTPDKAIAAVNGAINALLANHEFSGGG